MLRMAATRRWGPGPATLEARRAPAREALPFGPVGYDLTAPELLLHTLVSADAWDVLVRHRVLRADPARIDDHFRASFDWIRKQAHRRLPTAVGRYPLWAWARIPRADLLTFVARCARWDPGSVFVTVRVPRERVLLSLFDEWHAVLNGVPAFPDDMAADVVDAWFDRLSASVPDWMLPGRSWSEWPAQLRAELEQSWMRIFDVDTAPNRAWVQATVEELFANDVVDAVVPVGRRGVPAVEGILFGEYGAVRAHTDYVEAARGR
jgi:hypothetical protein